MIRATGNDVGSQRDFAREQLATIAGLVKQADASGDAETALRLRQVATSPNISNEAIQAAITGEPTQVPRMYSGF